MPYDFRARSNASMKSFSVKSRTKQNFKDQCDINNIIKKYRKNGVNPFVVTESARYGDYSEVPSYQDSLNFIISADEAFMKLDPRIRARFQNNPGLLIDFCADPNNREEAVKLGLIEKVVPQGTPSSESGVAGSVGASGANATSTGGVSGA